MSFMAEQNRADSRQEQVYPKCCISAIIWNSPWTAHGDGSVRLWEIISAKQLSVFNELEQHDRDVGGAIGFLSNSQTIYIVTLEGELIVLDALSMEEIGSRLTGISSASAFALSPDLTRLAVGTIGGWIHIVGANGSAEGDARKMAFGVHRGAVTTLMFSANESHLVSGGIDGTVRTWDLSSKMEIARENLNSSIGCIARTLEDEKIAVFGQSRNPPVIVKIPGRAIDANIADIPKGKIITKSVDSRYMVAVENSGLTVWDAIKKSQKIVPLDDTSAINAIAISDDGAHLALSLEDSVVVRTVLTNASTTIRFPEEIDHHATAMAFSADNSHLLIGTGQRNKSSGWFSLSTKPRGRLLSANLRSGRVVDRVEYRNAIHTIVKISTQSDVMRSVVKFGNSNDDKVLTLSSRGEISSLDTTAIVPDVSAGASISRNGRLIASSQSNGDIRLFDASTGAEIVRFKHPTPNTPEILFDNNGDLLSYTNDSVGRWELSWIPDGTYFQIVCAYLPDSDLEDALSDYPITINEPICNNGYDPPLP